ncbi:hypothetical protein JTB14_006697 [Gonioctena quinquepunctata]|nr:hypothetical protein JTB14_006697 [Gonioctena quinquepunctata]
MITDDPQLSKTLLSEYLHYYATALLWLMIINLKQKNSQPLTKEEQDLLVATQTTSFSVPEPLVLQYKHSFHPKTNLGYYGTPEPPAADVDNYIHIFYEEIPCLGVTAEAVRRSISDAPVGAYASESSQFLQAISNVHSLTKTFKNTDMVFSTLSESGSQSQVVISWPITQANMNNLLGETRPTSLAQEQLFHYGSVVFFDSQLLKEPGVRDNHSTWCCVTFQVATPIPWINNRNARRNLLLQCMEQLFQSVSLNAMTYRINIIKQLVISKR